MDKIKTLSQAMRYGAKLKPQGFGHCFSLHPEGGIASCAIGSAYDAMNVASGQITACEVNTRTAITALGERYMFNPNQPMKPPLKLIMHPCRTLAGVITALNDSGAMTREDIADWLEKEGL